MNIQILFQFIALCKNLNIEPTFKGLNGFKYRFY